MINFIIYESERMCNVAEENHLLKSKKSEDNKKKLQRVILNAEKPQSKKKVINMNMTRRAKEYMNADAIYEDYKHPQLKMM